MGLNAASASSQGEDLPGTLRKIMYRVNGMIAYNPVLDQDKRNASTMAICAILTSSDWSTKIDATGLFEWKMALSTTV